jgi:tRNA A-37 threonylcarbamoyl transferase component Bud32/tetratricopeptide (TPR) repeat protein
VSLADHLALGHLLRVTTSDAIPRLNATLEGRYRVQRELGEGGMATVYLADDLRHERRVALKVLKPELSAIVGAERFLAEIRTTANLQHPHILPLFDSGEADGMLFYVMPHVEGGSLRERMDRQRQFGAAETIAMMTKVASALDYAHGRGVVHRDIKPSNILLSEQGEPLVADFGIALALDAAGDARVTQTGFIVGTPAYSSPEQAAAEPDVDGASDQYSLACVAFEMLAGEPPYTGPTAHAITSKRLTTPIPSVRTARGTLPTTVDAALKRALATVPRDRFETVGAFAAALARQDRVAAPGSGRSTARTAAVLVAAALVAIVGGAVWLASRPEPTVRGRVVVGEFENLTGDPALDAAGRAASEWLSQSLAQASIAEAVLPFDALPSSQGSGFLAPGTSTAVISEAARRSGFGTVITGSYYLRGDSLEFQAQVTNADDGSLITGAGPVRGRVDEPLETASLLADQLLGRLGSYLDPLLLPESWSAAVRPPNYRAWQAHVRARDLIFADEYTASAAAALEAITIDPSFGRPYRLAMEGLHHTGESARADSVLRQWEHHLPEMLPVDRSNFAMVRAEFYGDLATAISSARESARLAPDQGPHLHAMWVGSVSPRPAVSVELYDSRDAERPIWRTTSDDQVWTTNALHVLGSYDRELAVALAGQEDETERVAPAYAELRALVALGRVDEAMRGLGALPALVSHRDYLPAVLWTPGIALSRLAKELAAHGHPAEASVAAERAVGWYDGRPATGPFDREDRVALAEALILLGRLDEARGGLERGLSEAPDDVAYLGLLGVAAARSGDSTEAGRLSDALTRSDPTYAHGEPSYWRARIAAALGEGESAASLLQEALTEGSYRRLHIHADFPEPVAARFAPAGG